MWCSTFKENGDVSGGQFWVWHLIRLKKKKILCLKAAACICFSVCVWFSKIQGLNFFFACLIFFPVFYGLACQNIQENIWQTQWNTLNNRLLQLCVLSCILFIQNKIPYFKAVTDSHMTRLLLRKKKKKNAFRSCLPICHELWDIAFIFLALKLVKAFRYYNWRRIKHSDCFLYYFLNVFSILIVF